MARDMYYVVIYDVSLSKERDKVAQVLEGYGRRVQKSAFECRLTKSMHNRLKKSLEKLALETGFVYLYRINRPVRRMCIGVDPGIPIDDDEYAWVV